MLVLVDYDNLDNSIKQGNISLVVEHIIDRIGEEADEFILTKIRNITIRLYGGWYDLNSMTALGQKISSDCARNFPTTIEISKNQNVMTKIVKAGLAVSLLCEPRVHLLNTYRKRKHVRGIRAENPRDVGCIEENCGLRILKTLFKKGKCIQCGIPLEKLVSRNEQKLVDSMLLVDLLTACENQLHNLIVIVSSDEDIWPCLLKSSFTQLNVIHLQAVRGREMPYHYKSQAGPYYKEILFVKEE